GRYNPGTDSWTATSTTGAPAARLRHTAVWTGTEMIVWGGTDNSSFLNTGGRYNPGTNSWTATSTTSAPAARDFHTAVWTGSEMIVWGGVG
ncbi:MAG: galactose oxidase, partial [Verrucomicrobia bacterium]